MNKFQKVAVQIAKDDIKKGVLIDLERLGMHVMQSLKLIKCQLKKHLVLKIGIKH